jgi:hypothetical protein
MTAGAGSEASPPSQEMRGTGVPGSESKVGRHEGLRRPRVAYLRAADNVSRLLPIWLRGVNQLIVRSRNLFSSSHLPRLVYN